MRFVFFICSLAGTACLPLQVFAQNTFQSRYVLQQSLGGASILQLPANGSLVMGHTQTNCGLTNKSCRYYLNANRVSNSGYLQWHKNYSTEYTYTTYETKSVATADGGFAFLQDLIDTATGHYHGGLLVKCNAKGGVEWAKQIVSKTYAHFDPDVLAQDDEGNLLLFYTVSKDRFSSSILQVVKVSGAGKLLWHKTIQTTYFGYTYYIANSFRQVKNKYYVAGAFNYQYFEGLLGSNLLVLDTGGNIAKFKEIDVDGLPSTLYNTEALQAFSNDNQLYLLGSYVNNEPEIGNRYYLLPLSDTTTIATGTLLPYTDFALQHYLRGYKDAFPFSYYSSFRKNGSFVTLVHEAGYTYLKQYDRLGRICPNYTLPFVDSQLLTKQFTVTDNTDYRSLKDSVYLTDKKVSVSSGSISYALVCNGSPLLADDEQSMPLTTSNISDKTVFVYPNPARDVVYISGLQNKASVVLLSSTGAIIKTYSLSAMNTTILVSGMAKGVYYLRISEHNAAPRVVTFIKE